MLYVYLYMRKQHESDILPRTDPVHTTIWEARERGVVSGRVTLPRIVTPVTRRQPEPCPTETRRVPLPNIHGDTERHASATCAAPAVLACTPCRKTAAVHEPRWPVDASDPRASSKGYP